MLLYRHLSYHQFYPVRLEPALPLAAALQDADAILSVQLFLAAGTLVVHTLVVHTVTRLAVYPMDTLDIRSLEVTSDTLKALDCLAATATETNLQEVASATIALAAPDHPQHLTQVRLGLKNLRWRLPVKVVPKRQA